MKGTFRVAGELAQFYGELDALKKTKKTLLVWQTNAEGNRATYDGIIKSYLANKVETVINIGIENAENMATDLPIFIYEDDKGILFKGEFKHYMNGLLKIKADEKVFLKERRSCQRINFHYTSVYVNVQFSQKLDFHKIKLKDISIQGFSIFTTETMATAFKKGLDLNITSINGIEIPVKLEGAITHKTRSEGVKGAAKGQFLIGVKFNQESKLIAKVIEALKE